MLEGAMQHQCALRGQRARVSTAAELLRGWNSTNLAAGSCATRSISSLCFSEWQPRKDVSWEANLQVCQFAALKRVFEYLVRDQRRK
jgi:hypothetical protein